MSMCYRFVLEIDGVPPLYLKSENDSTYSLTTRRDEADLFISEKDAALAYAEFEDSFFTWSNKERAK